MRTLILLITCTCGYTSQDNELFCQKCGKKLTSEFSSSSSMNSNSVEYCENCRQKLESYEIFCKNCGVKIGKTNIISLNTNKQPEFQNNEIECLKCGVKGGTRDKYCWNCGGRTGRGNVTNSVSKINSRLKNKKSSQGMMLFWVIVFLILVLIYIFISRSICPSSSCNVWP